MADTGYKDSLGNDLDTILEPIGSGTPGPDTGYKNQAGVDLAQLYYFGQEGGSPTQDPLGYYVGDGTSGVDLGTFFAEEGSVAPEPSYPDSNDNSLYYSTLDGYGNYSFANVAVDGTVNVSRAGTVRQDLELPATGIYHMEWTWDGNGNIYHNLGLEDDTTNTRDYVCRWDNRGYKIVTGYVVFDMGLKTMEIWGMDADDTVPIQHTSGTNTKFTWTEPNVNLKMSIWIGSAGSGGCNIKPVMNPADYQIGGIFVTLPAGSVALGSLYL